ncbi:hypothetical protein Tco_0513676, partial [Tanacetum coccineum]
PSARSNQGTKRRRSDSAASGSAKPPPKADDQSSKKPRESEASASKQHPTLTSTGWQITDTREAGVDSSMHRSDPESEHSEQSSDDISKQDEGNDSDMEDTDNAHIPKVSTTTWFKPIPESERPATPEPEWTIPPNDFPEPEHNWANAYATTYKVPEENKLQRKTYDIGSFIKWFCRRTGKKKLCKADLEGPAFNLVKAFHKNNVFLQYQMDECHKLLTNKVDLSNPEGHQIPQNINEPLPLGGPPGQVTIQPQFFFNKDLDYLLTGDKERKIALSISKLKAARYLDFGLEELVPSLWVESEREYDISAVYGITHWWFRRKEFYINKHSESSDREAVRSQMRILSVISDFKNLHPNDFEDLFLLNIQEKLNHLPKTDKTSLHTAVNMWIRNLVIRNRVGDLQLGIESYQTKINLERPNWDAADYYFKEDYTIVPLARAVVYRDRNDQRKLMRLNELHKFSDGTLTRIMEKLDHMVKDFHLFEYNKGMETRKWSEDDKRRSKDFITAIEKRLQIRRIYRSLESFVGGRIRDIDYRLINRTTIYHSIAYADALRDRGIDARVVVEAIDRDETETGMRGPVEVRVERVTHPVMPEDIPEPTQEGAVEVTYETLGDLVQRFHDHTQAILVHRIQVIEGVQREQGHRIVGVESAVIALTERIAELERDNRRLRDTGSVESQRVDRLQRGMSRMQRELRQMRRL